MSKNTVQVRVLNPKDNVAVALTALGADQVIQQNCNAIITKEQIPKGHKVAIKKIPKGEDIVKYGIVIGVAISDIDSGSWVHTHNVYDNTEELCEEYAHEIRNNRDKGSVYANNSGI